jgi:hypothetical protein
MKWKLTALLMATAALLQQFQCNRCDYVCAESGSFKIVDSKTGADLFFGPLAKYEADSVWLTAETIGTNAWSQAWLMRYDSMFSMHPQYRIGQNYPADTLYLKNNMDIDTIHLVFNPKATDCCKPYFYIKAILFNGISAIKKDGYWIFTKY